MGEQRPSKPLPANQLTFEQAAMEQICELSGNLGEIVKRNYQSAKVVERWGSGAGFYTDYEIGPNDVAMPHRLFGDMAIATFEMMGVGRIEDESPDGYVLMMCQLNFSDDGRSFGLECVNFGGGRWPSDRYVWRNVARVRHLGSSNG